MLVNRNSQFAHTLWLTHMWGLWGTLFLGFPLYLILYIGLVLVRAKHYDSEELHKGITLYVSRKVERVIGKRIEVNSMRSVPNDMTDALNHCVLSASTILDLALLFLLFLSNHTIFNFLKSIFFDTLILVPFVTLNQGLNPWRWKRILFMVPTDIAAFRNISWSFSLCIN